MESDARDGLPLSSMMRDAQRYMSSIDFEQAFENFSEQHANAWFDVAETKGDDIEHKLIFQELHTEYLDLFESKIEGFLDSRGYSVEEFYKACREAMEDMYTPLFEEHEHHWFVELLLASIDYSRFHGLMLNEARKQLRTRRK